MPQKIIIFGFSFIGATLIAFVHLFVHRMSFLRRRNSIWLDILAGVAFSYLFIDIFPHLASFQRKLLMATIGGILGFLEHHAYLLAMLSFLLYLGIFVAEEQSRSFQPPETETGRRLTLTMSFETFSIIAYTFIIGYMLAEKSTHQAGAGLGFGIAMTAHFMGLDNFFRELYPRFYHNKIRYVSVVAIYSGWILGVFGELPDELYALLFSFLAGALIIITVIYELPRVKTWRTYFGFCLGAFAFTGMILLEEIL